MSRRLPLDPHRTGRLLTIAFVALGCSDSTVGIRTEPPMATIIAPHDGHSGLDTVITLEGRVSDSRSAAGDLLVEWTSSLDEALFVGSPDAEGRTLVPVELSSGEHVLTLNATDEDGQTATDQVVVRLGNTPPTVTGVALTPEGPTETDTITASLAELTDPDDQELTVTWRWTVSGVEVADHVEPTLTGVWFDRGDEVVAEATPHDGIDSGTPVASAPLLVLNTPPTAPTPVVPVEAAAGEELDCTVASEASDVDGDELTYVLAWSRDGSPTSHEAEGGPTAVATVPAGTTVAGEEWSCGTRASDQEASGPEGSASVLVSVADLDGDGSPDDEDCDDSNPNVFPGAGDVYGDGLDADCDGRDCEAAWLGTTYFVACTELMLWADAGAECSTMGYDGLATVVDAQEQAFLEDLRPLPATVKHWIGFNDVAVDGVYEWTSGLPVTFTNWYTATEPTGQPGTDEDCVHFHSSVDPADGQWNDNWCSSMTHGWFCELR